MPNSKKRDTHKHPHIDYIPHEKKKGSAKIPIAIFCAVLALFIAWFTVGVSAWLFVIIILGAGLGYLLGSQMDKSMNKG
jgi:hypothetical protein